MLYWESQGPRSQLLLLIKPQIACIVMCVLLVCDFCQTTYSLRHVCSWIFLKKPLINTDSLHINYHFHFFFIITGSRYAMYCSWYSKKSFNNKEVEFEWTMYHSNINITCNPPLYLKNWHLDPPPNLDLHPTDLCRGYAKKLTACFIERPVSKIYIIT